MHSDYSCSARFAISAARLALLLSAAGLLASAQDRIDLGGRWDRILGDEAKGSVPVPSSYRPVGRVTLRRSFDLPIKSQRRVLLKFAGIAYAGDVRINGRPVGSPGPWTPYRFDITDQTHVGNNRIEVDVSDSQVVLGPTGGWESYGGIIRSVSIDLRAPTYIDDAQLQYQLKDNFAQADCSLTVALRSEKATQGGITAQLLYGSAVVAEQKIEQSIIRGESRAQLKWNIRAPGLWSPENPNLYTLRVSLSSPEGNDEFTSETGFRQIEIQGNSFLLNGRRLILRGVCRHDLWYNQGYTLTDAQIDQDMRMIKALGANFVRLVHYPHDVRVIQKAAQIGLLVTEESGLVWVDFRTVNRAAVESGLENLERTVRRDWNNPALFAVLVANESAVTPQVMQEAKRRVRALKPDLLVSSARVDSPDRTLEGSKKLFDEGGLDFYAYHPYTFDMDDFEKVATVFTGKPLVFTEWGGRSIGDSPVMMEATTKEINRLTTAKRLAGHSFWSWSDLPEFSRQGEEMHDGILASGVVTEQRVLRPTVSSLLTELFRQSPSSQQDGTRTAQFMPTSLAPLSINSVFTPVPLQSVFDQPEQRVAWLEMEMTIQAFWKTQGFTSRHWAETGMKFWTWDAERIQIGGVPFVTPLRQGHTEPVVLSASRPQVSIPIHAQADRLLVLGNVTFPDGYPIIGAFGNLVGRYRIIYADGDAEQIDLHWGREIARANMIALASRIDPSTEKGERAVEFVKDPVREIYQTRLLPIATKPKMIERLEFERQISKESGTTPPRSMHHTPGATPGADQQALALFAVTIETHNESQAR